MSPVPPITIPDALVVFIAAGVTYLVTQGVKAVARVFGRDISGKAAVVAALITQCILVFGNGLLASASPQNQQLAATVFSLIVLTLGAAGIHSTVGKLSGTEQDGPPQKG